MTRPKSGSFYLSEEDASEKEKAGKTKSQMVGDFYKSCGINDKGEKISRTRSMQSLSELESSGESLEEYESRMKENEQIKIKQKLDNKVPSTAISPNTSTLLSMIGRQRGIGG